MVGWQLLVFALYIPLLLAYHHPSSASTRSCSSRCSSTLRRYASCWLPPSPPPRSLVRSALTQREFGPVKGYEEPAGDKIEVLMTMFKEAGSSGVRSGADAEKEKGVEVDASAVETLEKFAAQAMELNLGDTSTAFRRAQEMGAEALQAERAELRDAVATLAAQAESVQLGFMVARADEGFRALAEEWLPAMGLPGPTAGPKLNAPTQICEQQSFLLYDSARDASSPPQPSSGGDGGGGGGENGQSSVTLRPFEGDTRGVLFMPRFGPAPEEAGGDADQWSLNFGELPTRLFFSPPPPMKFKQQ